ncbi:unnamed protein product [Amoebophrya sp. A25]|nr:unnamed protein product [Amoebophrya sp. A25]|eukprot:GSA25T00020353001.1
MSRAFVLSSALAVTGAMALEPFVPPIAIQDVMQASLPSVIDIHYDVPHTSGGVESAKAVSDADAVARSTLYGRTSFLKRGTTDVYFENPAPAATLEASYQAILGAVKSNIKAKFDAMRGSFLGGATSFLQGEPAVNVFVGEGKGMKVDMSRLSTDSYAYAAELLSGLENEMRASFLAGDDVPKPLPVLNVDVTTPAFVSQQAMTQEKVYASEIETLQGLLGADQELLSGLQAARAK